jgi:voltage-gated potassium channel
MHARAKDRRRFSVVHHVPHYSKLLFQAVLSPLLIYFAAAGNLVLFFSSALFFLFENGINSEVNTYFDAIWWAFSTVSTVGFGDVVPITVGGRLVGIFLMIFGVAFFVGFTALLISVILSMTDVDHEYEELLRAVRELSEKVDKLKAD